MKEAVNLTYKDEDAKEFFVRASKLCKKANFNEGTKHGMIMEAIKSDQSLLQFTLLRKVNTFDDVRKTCLEYAEHQNMYSLPKGVTEKPSGCSSWSMTETGKVKMMKHWTRWTSCARSLKIWRHSLRRVSQSQAYKT